ncbi:MAG: T9SS type A sorting domain-containing protein, partial [Flavobacteriales bacterium]|nr:T9SS type A sorting domain-containing protein [Flavobacteriales bacterium]
IIEDNFDSIWGRDYGAHTIYRDDVDELLLVDWIYNRNRPADDNIPITIAQHAGVPLYSTTEEPYDLMATGGNFMSDGMGTGFSSELILEENEGGMTWWGAQFPDHTVEDIDNIVFDFMGIDRYIKMEVLPYDLIHHIDMHMKLLDEETILMGEYPAGVADGPQIEANLEYVLSNYESSFGTPYEVVRIQMPPDGNAYPNTSGDYRTYTNLVFVNKTVIVPTYEEQYDAPALEILAEQLPGYNVVGIQCNDIIQLSGAIHCITKAVGVSDPLLIVHDHLDDTDNETDDYQVDATIQHVSDINEASVFYSINGADFIETSMVMTSTIDDTWTAYIPAQPQGTEIDYYIDAMANSGKEQVRPIVAPEGHWTFNIVGEAVGIEELAISSPISAVYPNPANGITVVQLDMPTITSAVRLSLKDMLGRDVLDIHAGTLARGQNKFFFNAETLPAGVYSVVLEAGDQRYTTPLMVR